VSIVAQPLDRRAFLVGSGRAAVAAAGVAGSGALLAACSSSGGKTGGGQQTPAANAGVSTAQPKRGGKLRVGVGSEIDGFDPASNHWDQTGHTYAVCIYDSLANYGADLKVKPYLAKSIEHNADYTEWTIVTRAGIKFHDGEQLDAAAVKTNLDRSIASPLTGSALANVAAVQVTAPDTVVVKMKSPWVPFDTYLVPGSQLGYMVSPKAIEGGKVSTAPVGTGPFVFQEWKVGDHFTATRNQSYWRSGLPYLDTVTFRPIPDSQARGNSLRAGDIDVMYGSTAQNIVDFRNDKNVTYVDDMNSTLGEPTLVFFMVNTAVPPVDDIRVRQAMAYATDQEKLVKVAGLGVGLQFLPITGPFDKGSPYYARTSYPAKPDLAKAKSLVQDYVKDKGSAPKFKLGTTNDPTNVQNTQLVQAMWRAAGLDVDIDVVEQASYITNALVGSYQVYGWIQFGASDPDQNFVWWSQDTVAPVGSLSLNFARNKDPQIQAALEKGRASGKSSDRAAAYQTVMSRLADDLPFIWASRSVGSAMARPNVMNFVNPTLPDSDSGPALTGYHGLVYPASTWLA
jgi:ABC-type transport system substrate-binding protein